MLEDMAAAAEHRAEAATAISEAAVEPAARLADQSAAAVRASVVENKCDDLAQEKVAAGAASSRGAALPSLSPTEVYTRAA